MAAVVIPAVLQGCSSDNPLCCTEYQAGATLNVSIGGNAQAQVAVQAIGDFSAIASSAIDDLTTACRGIATDLDGAPAANTVAQRTSIEAGTDKREKMKSYCALAVDALTASIGSASLTFAATAPVCEASISAKASCQAKCTGSASCDLKANPPTCTGGDLNISCNGACTAKASAASVKCEGSCSAACTGSCTAQGGVQCAGKCNGSCTAGAGGSGPQADGTCKGTCAGTCEVTAPGVTCTGSCQGQCAGTCTATPGSASVQCDGSCSGDFTPVSCSGGTLEGGCKVDAQCDANCNASVSAKASCTPPSLSITFTGSDNLGKVKATLEANLPTIIAFKSRLSGMAQLTATIGGNATAVASIKTACIPVVIASAADAVEDVGASVTATTNLVGAAKFGG